MAINSLPDLETQQRIAAATEEIASKIAEFGTGAGTGTGGGGGYIDINYADLVILRDSSSLEKGAFYRITDYETKTSQPETQSAGHLFDIIVQALDELTVSENASAIYSARDTTGYFYGMRLEAWKLKYTLENDMFKYGWANPENGKGVIYRMIDEYENDLPYDFKNIQFKRYKITTLEENTELEGKYYALKDSDGNVVPSNASIDEGDFIWAYTFTTALTSDGPYIETTTLNKQSDAPIPHCAKNTFGDSIYLPFVDEDISCALGNNVIYNEIEFIGNTGYSYPPHSNTIGDNFNSNTIGKSFISNTIGDNFYYNTIEYGFDYNTIGHDFSENTIGADFHSNTIGHDFRSNFIGEYAANNSIGNGFSYNTIVSNFVSNTIGNNFNDNIIENGFSSNTIGDDFARNNIETGANNNTIRNDFNGNTIEYNFFDNTIGNNFNGNTTGYDFHNNTIGNDFERNTIGYNFHSNAIEYGAILNTIGNEFVGNTIGNDFGHNTIVDRFRNNTIGNDFGMNPIGDNFISNTIGNNFYFNTNIGHNFQGNTIGNDFNHNTTGVGFVSNTIGNNFSENIIGNNFYYNAVGNDVLYIQFSVDGTAGVDGNGMPKPMDAIIYLHLKSGLKGSSTYNKLDLYYDGLYGRGYPTTFELIANGNVISSWEATPLTRAGKVKATNTTATWSDILGG